MASWKVFLFGSVAFIGVYIVGRAIGALLGYGLHLTLGDALSVMLPTILAVHADSLVRREFR